MKLERYPRLTETGSMALKDVPKMVNSNSETFGMLSHLWVSSWLTAYKEGPIVATLITVP